MNLQEKNQSQQDLQSSPEPQLYMVAATESPSSNISPVLGSSDIGPRTWKPKWQSEMMSGIGAMAAAIVALAGAIIGYVPPVSSQFPVAAAIILSVVCIPMSIYFWYIAIRRMRWEHANGGILRRSLSGGGIVFAIVVFVGITLLIINWLLGALF